MNKKETFEYIQRCMKSKGHVYVSRSMGGYVSKDSLIKARGSKPAEGTFRFVFTDESVDDYGTVFKADAWDMSGFARNGIITAQHPYLGDTNTYVFIGKSTIERNGTEYLGDVTFQEGNNPIARDVKEKVEQEIWNGTSIYARVTDYRMGDEKLGEDPEIMYFTKASLVAVGIVAIPSNSNAIRVNAIRVSIDEDDQEEEEQMKEDTELRIAIDRITTTRIKALCLS